MSERDKREWAAIKADPERHRLYLDAKRLQRAARQLARGYETKRKRTWRAANRKRDRRLHAAHYAVEKALKTGVLVKPDRCGRCEKVGPVEAHHYRGYEPEHRLDVKWLCTDCHAALHAKIKASEPRSRNL